MTKKIATGASWKKRVAAATVRVSGRVDPSQVGQGVLVPGGFVLTAAHCVEWHTNGGMATGDYCLADVETCSGARFRLSIAAVEPVADIAVLAAPDNQVFVEDVEAFESFVEKTLAVPIRTDDLHELGRLEAHVRTHQHTWTEGEVWEGRRGYRARGSGALMLPKKAIVGGTSGGPVVDDRGRLIGLISQSDVRLPGDLQITVEEARHLCNVAEPSQLGSFPIPRPHRALPGWLWVQIDQAQRATESEFAVPASDLAPDPPRTAARKGRKPTRDKDGS